MYFSKRIACCVLIVGLLLLVASTSLADEKVDVGELAPVFESIDEFGRPWRSSRHVQRKIVVLYFYPGDFTSNCTRAAQSFRDNMEALRAKGVKVVGVSGDVPATHQLFKEAHKLNYTLLADPEGAVAKLFGVPVGAGGKVRARTADGEPLWDADGKTLVVSRPVTLARWTLILDRDGKVAYKNTKADPLKSAQDILQIVEDLEKKPK
jgi:peroxiredoxin Q/BCP